MDVKIMSEREIELETDPEYSSTNGSVTPMKCLGDTHEKVQLNAYTFE